MGDLPWSRKKKIMTFPLAALRHHAVCLGASGSGKTETLYRCAYGACKVYHQQVIYLDAKGESKRVEEKEGDNAARFVATMRLAGAQIIKVFPETCYNGWLGTPIELQNRLLSVIDFAESQYYGDVAANVVYLALHTPVTPRSSVQFLNNLRLDRLKALYKNDPLHYERVKRLDRNLLAQVQMRYEVFFNAMHGQLDGDLSYDNADAVYLRVRGFTLRQEAPRLGRFLVADFMHYIAERRRAGANTLFIIDEFNALRMREETSILFEQVRSFGGSLIIAAQGYTGLGPSEYANRILDATNTYILHSCSDPFPVAKRAGKCFRLETSWNEQEGERASSRRQVRSRWDWKVPEHAVMQQTEGQAFWINRGRAQQAQTARVPLTIQQITEAWEEIKQQEEAERTTLERAKLAQAKQPTRAKTPSQVPPATSSVPPKKVSNVSAESTKVQATQKETGESPSASPESSLPQPSPSVQLPPSQDDEPDIL